jgi:hypothetical protein
MQQKQFIKGKMSKPYCCCRWVSDTTALNANMKTLTGTIFPGLPTLEITQNAG